MTASTFIAIEGPCCAGKTTLAKSLLTALGDVTISHVECYADHVGGGRFLPDPVPTTLTEDYLALGALIEIEDARLVAARKGTCDLALLDRSAHTFLAHRYAILHRTGLDCFSPAVDRLRMSTVPVWPDLVIYLDVAQATVHQRNDGKFPVDSIFIDAGFNAAIRQYYTNLRMDASTTVMWLDAQLDSAELVTHATDKIRSVLSMAS